MNEKSDKQVKSSDDIKPPKASGVEKQLEEKIEKLEEDIAGYQDKNTRLLAEQQNLVTRLNREFDTKVSYAISKFAKDILDVADVLQAGLDNCENKESEHYNGMDMTLDKLLSILKQYGISSIESEGKFDPNVHEALTTQENDEVENGTILHVVQPGYLFKERILRPAKVIVSKNISKEG